MSVSLKKSPLPLAVQFLHLNFIDYDEGADTFAVRVLGRAGEFTLPAEFVPVLLGVPFAPHELTHTVQTVRYTV